jgi:hypothetical protein
VCVRDRERERVYMLCVYLCVSVCERERERVCVYGINNIILQIHEMMSQNIT